jgi:hypothetical protein
MVEEGMKHQVCANCGNDFERPDLQRCCSNKCKYEYRKKQPITVHGKMVIGCYKKEAKAILEGKKWEGKNKCIDLPEEPDLRNISASRWKSLKCKGCGRNITASHSKEKGLCTKCDKGSGMPIIKKNDYVEEVRKYMTNFKRVMGKDASLFDVSLELHFSERQARDLMREAMK